MSYEVLARKWRPHSFDELVGQQHVVQALSNALDNDRLHHAYLFTGTRGVGKTTLARIFAKALNCEEGISSKPCGECSSCQEIDQGRFIDLLEVDAASRTKVEQTRELLENVPYAPVRGRYKVYLIDEVHMFSAGSFNALLKTLEEPPPHVKFLLATTDPQRLPMTVLSRCLQFGLKRLTHDQIAGQLQHILISEKVEFDPQALALLASGADGSMRDGLSLMDQAIAFGAGEVRESQVQVMLGTVSRDYVYGLLDAVSSGNGVLLMERIAEVAERAPDFRSVLDEMLRILHRIAIELAVPGVGREEADASRLTEMVNSLQPEEVQLYYQIGVTGKRDIIHAPDLRSGFEMVLLRMLAFRPDAGDSRPQQAAVKKRTQQLPAAGAAPAQSPSRPVDQKIQQASPDYASGKQAAAVQAQSTQTSTASATAATATNQTPVIGEWSAIVAQLDLGGVSRQLAVNCALKSIDDKRVCLALQQNHQALKSEMSERRLQAALCDHFDNKSLLLEIEIGEPGSDTPAQQQAQADEQKVVDAREQMAQDPLVKAAQQQLGATLLEETVKPV
ncbi:MAG: DNA polymerase III subunit gamma/tau [Gammaproteobacteria bacterium]|nr:DNA polymerase III subunit gamma/tau [Gammaproteobacteria bacterium]